MYSKRIKLQNLEILGIDADLDTELGSELGEVAVVLQQFGVTKDDIPKGYFDNLESTLTLHVKRENILRHVINKEDKITLPEVV